MEINDMKADLSADGWSKSVLDSGVLAGLSVVELAQARLFASPLFIALWRAELSHKPTQAKAIELLTMALTYIDMPDDLAGTVTETKELLGKIGDIAPHALFWRDFSKMVKLALPGETFSLQEGNLALKRRIHQFRYVISAQQAQWVRDHFRQKGMTDAEALATYLGSQPRYFALLRWYLGLRPAYQVKTSARLHNKRALGDQGQGFLPDMVLRYNIKVLLGFHTEFILSNQGDFLNELEVEKPSLSGVVNGASFNYGGGRPKDHLALDVKTVKPYDPAFRRRLVKNGGYPFRNPDKRAYRNKGDVIFADGNQALIRHIKRVQGEFLQLIKKS